VHAHTFTGEGKPPVLLDVMRACGALLSKTPEAASFIYRTLLNAREFLLQELVIMRFAWCGSGLLIISVQSTRADDEAYTRDLLTAAILLQAIGTFHEDAAERRKSSVFHGFLVKVRHVSLVICILGGLLVRRSLSLYSIENITEYFMAGNRILRASDGLREFQRH